MRNSIALLVVGVSISFDTACVSQNAALDPNLGIARAAATAITTPQDQLAAYAPLDPKSPQSAHCEREARIWIFVSNLPGISTLVTIDRELASNATTKQEAKWGECLLNPITAPKPLGGID